MKPLLAAALDVAGDQEEDGHVRLEACELIQKFCDDSTFHALVNSVPTPGS